MEEEVGVKVTRLRRRLSIEAEDVKSPSKQSTPTKKRGGRLATKPQLELIDENATEEVKPKRTRKSIARDIEAEEKIITPSRRSNRIKSNTSIVSETAVEDEGDKGTPSRRTNRIKSNTSIVAESVQFTDSPRAKRAARRVSQLDSDNESAITPARQTRRTAKDSTPTANKQVEKKAKNELDTESNEVLVTENDNTKKDNNIEENSSKGKTDSPPVRKSPRFVDKSDHEVLAQDDQNNKENELQTVETSSPAITIEHIDVERKSIKKNDSPKESTHSISCSNLLNELAGTPKQKNACFNKSTSALEEPKLTNRRRTKSWATISSIVSNDNNFMSDTEITKKKTRNNNNSHNLSSGDGIINTSKQKIYKDILIDDNIQSNKNGDEAIKHPNRKSSSSLETSIKNEFNVSCNYDLDRLSSPQKGKVKSVIYIEDTDSNTLTFENTNNKEINSEDQCVPIANHEKEVSQSRVNLSYEPMDIDESLTDNNVSTSIFTVTENVVETDSDLHSTSQKLSNSFAMGLKDDSFNKSDSSTNKNTSVSKRKSSIQIVEENNQSQTLTTNNTSVNNILNKSEMETSINSKNHDNNTSCRNKSDNIISNTSVNNSNLNKSKHNLSNFNHTDKNISVNTSVDNHLHKDTNNKVETTGKEEVNDVSINSAPAKDDSFVADVCPENKIEENEKQQGSDKSINLSSTKVSIQTQHTQLQSLDESTSDNKSTLVPSQTKSTPNTIQKNDPLSKSLNIPNSNKDNKKKNISLSYSTSTPLLEKSKKKYLNTSANVSEISLQQEKKNKKIKVDHKTPALQNDTSNSSDEDDGTEEESDNEHKYVDDEAEEVNSDYESGDSRDEDEIEYEKENEIVEKGETLDSEDDDFSDDSEYEKGSFIVDSEPEDNDLLSGSGDDLSMSVEELSMSAKSKKKFNERKIKEQKKASREMYEARHELDETAGSTKSNKVKSKKVNRQRLESTTSENESDSPLQPKKHRRARIDSSQDISVTERDAENSISKNKKKVRPLSKSVCEETEFAEKEISVHQSLEADKIDPLSLQNSFKKEPQTPETSIALKNREEFENVEVDENVSMIKMNSKQTSDPLQTTVAQENESNSDESISENEEITQNYDLILNDLNSLSKLVNSSNASLNLNKKSKNKTKEPIFDELNLTQTKPKKTKTQSLNISTKEKDDDIKNNMNIQDENSSDSINMKLLFDEDSTDNENKMPTENIIPLKRIDGKTNILENTDEEDDKEDEEDIPFFVDTTGTHADVDPSLTIDTSFKASINKRKMSLTKLHESNVGEISVTETSLNTTDSKKKKKLSMSHDKPEADSSDEAPLEISIGKETSENINTSILHMDTSQTGKKKKKSKKSLNNSVTTANELVPEDEKSLNNTNISLTGSNKKKKKLSVSLNQQESDVADVPLNESHSNERNIITEQILDNVEGTETNLSTKKKKKNKKSLNSSQNIEKELFMEEDKGADATLDGSHCVDKDTSIKQDTAVTGAETSQRSKKKKRNKKKSLNSSQSTASELILEATEQAVVDVADVSVDAATNKKTSGLQQTAIVKEDIVESNEESISKKRKRKHSGNEVKEQELEIKVNESINLNEIPTVETGHKKKRKISHQQEDPSILSQEVREDVSQTKQTAKPKIQKNKAEDTPQVCDDTIRKNKKRKERDNDDSNKASKVIKQNSFDKVHVSRLPDSVIQQLDPKSKEAFKMPKPNVIATTNFKIEETRKRRTKPSNYLEKSVCLNDSIEENTKKSSLLKPKVLPFMPTVSTSDHGFTTHFRVNVIPQETKFVAQSSDVANFKNDYLHKNRIKKMGTLEMCKRRRNVKLCKF